MRLLWSVVKLILTSLTVGAVALLPFLLGEILCHLVGCGITQI